MQTLLCQQSGITQQWLRVQKGGIEGAAFRPDFGDNENVSADITFMGGDQARVGFGSGRAFHWWPRQGRVNLGSASVCGVLVMFQARVVASDGRELPEGTASTLLVGGGADYWLDTRVPWDQFRTNASVGVGPLRLARPQWRWFGISTAEAAALSLLKREGFVDRSSS